MVRRPELKAETCRDTARTGPAKEAERQGQPHRNSHITSRNSASGQTTYGVRSSRRVQKDSRQAGQKEEEPSSSHRNFRQPLHTERRARKIPEGRANLRDGEGPHCQDFLGQEYEGESGTSPEHHKGKLRLRRTSLDPHRNRLKHSHSDVPAE